MYNFVELKPQQKERDVERHETLGFGGGHMSNSHGGE
jgi:hypothetical protein